MSNKKVAHWKKDNSFYIKRPNMGEKGKYLTNTRK